MSIVDFSDMKQISITNNLSDEEHFKQVFPFLW